MGLFDKLFPSKKHEYLVADQYFKLLNGYTPVFRNWDGKLYESDLVRASIDARSRHISKLNVRIEGSAQPRLQTQLRHQPNVFTTWPQMLYRLNTILDMRGTAFLLPVYDRYMDAIGITTICPEKYEVVVADNEPWIRFSFASRQNTAEKLQNVGIMTRFQYENDLFGTDNTAMYETMQLIDLQNQSISEAVKTSGAYKFAARLNNFSKAEDLKNERLRFNGGNFGAESKAGGVVLFPNTYSDIMQVSSKQYVVDADQMKLIDSNVFNYFGVNEKILQNSANGSELDSFFNGAIEPFAVMLSDVLTKMLFTDAERSHGSRVYVSADRLQYMTVAEKINMAQQLGDRGMILIDEIRELFNYPPLPDGQGQKAPIRGEYYFADEKEADNANQE